MESGFGLLPGYGCYIQIDRYQDGTVGTLQVVYDDPNIRVFDDFNSNYTSGDYLSLPLTDYGWGPRKVFIVNVANYPTQFTAIY